MAKSSTRSKIKAIINIKSKDFVDGALCKIIEKSDGKEVVINRVDNIGKPIKLSHVFKFIPTGLVYKDETGMGATYLELESKRNSIIVEPIKMTASSKAKQHGAIYIGSPTKSHPKQITKKEIEAYLTDNSIKYKKIVCVADSLPKLLKFIGPDIFKEYFLLIDEIDSFQIDSTFRKSMDTTLEYYQQFEPQNRAMLSATKIEFSDPNLSKGPVTFIRYDKPSYRKVNVVCTTPKELQPVVIDMITTIKSSYPNDKIFVAFNSVTGCVNLAEHIVTSNMYQRKEVFIHCSSASDKRAGSYYHELDSDILPGKVNFFTSAYFTGFDINETYHLISVSSSVKDMQALSDRRLKQIAGRCRSKLKSEIVIHDIASRDVDTVTADELIKEAQYQIDAMKCTQMQYKKSPVLATMLKDINMHMMNFLENKRRRFVKEDLHGHYGISYLNIDAKLEAVRIKNTLYTNPKSLSDALSKQGNQVKYHYTNSSTNVDQLSSTKLLWSDEVSYIIDMLKRCNNKADLQVYLSKEKHIKAKKVFTDYSKLIEHVDHAKTLNMLETLLLSSSNLKKYNSFILSAQFAVLPDKHLHKRNMEIHFPIGDALTKDVIYTRLQAFLTESGVLVNDIKTPTKAVQFLGRYRRFYKKKQADGTYKFVITGDNPENITVTSTKAFLHAENTFGAIFGY